MKTNYFERMKFLDKEMIKINNIITTNKVHVKSFLYTGHQRYQQDINGVQ